MRDLDYYLRLNPKSADKNTYLSLIQRDISGGRVKRQDIDILREFPNVTEISISGLTQDTFDYFIENYGDQFQAIIFWKCPLVGNLKLLESLEHVEYIVYFWNQRAEKLWDLSKTKSLKGFSFDDFTRMPDISQISKSLSLEELHFGDKIWSKYVLNTLHPIAQCSSLKRLSFSAKKILDGKIEPIAYLSQLERLSFPTRLFTTQQVAWLKANLPDTVTSKELNAYWTLERPLIINGKARDTFIVGKRKPLLDSVQDEERIKKYVDQFDKMYQWYLENRTASAEAYKKAE
jgi:hypothetical protein